MRKLKSLENFNQGLAAEKTRMFQGGGEDQIDWTFITKGEDIQIEDYPLVIFVETFVETYRDFDILPD